MQQATRKAFQELGRGNAEAAISALRGSEQCLETEVGLAAAHLDLAFSGSDREHINEAIRHGRQAKQFGLHPDVAVVLAQAFAARYTVGGSEKDRRRALAHYRVAEKDIPKRPDFTTRMGDHITYLYGALL